MQAPEETSSAQSQAAGAAARSQETEMAAMGAADPSVNQPISAAARLTVHVSSQTCLHASLVWTLSGDLAAPLCEE